MIPTRLAIKANAHTLALIAILVIGFVIRIRQYLIGASLWVDEAALALNIIRGSYADLLRPLNYLQGSPVGFTWLTKLVITLANDGEACLRLVPLLAGLLTLVLFPLIARKYLSRNATLLALLILALSHRLIYYSTELKQYSVDVLMTVCGLALFLFLRVKPLTVWRAAVAIVAGSLMIWLSHPAVFVLGMVGLYALISAWRQANLQRLILVLIIGLIWLLSIAVLFYLSLENLTQNEELVTFWAGGFAPPVTTGIDWVRWHWDKFNSLATYGLGISASGLAVLTALVGILTFYRQDRGLLFSLLMPIILVLLAAWLKRYPFVDRLALFIAPLAVILVAQGVESFMRALRPLSRGIAYAVPVVLLMSPIFQGWELIRHPQYKEELSPVLADVRTHWQDGDHIYLYHSAYVAFEYYRPKYGFTERDYTLGSQSTKDWLVYFHELDELAERDGRVWLLFTHVHEGSGVNEEQLFINHLRNKGYTEEGKFAARNASAYLFDFRQTDE